MTRWMAPDGKSEVIDVSRGEGRIEEDAPQGGWRTPGGQLLLTEEEARQRYDTGPWADAAISVCAVLIIATACTLVLHWAGLL